MRPPDLPQTAAELRNVPVMVEVRVRISATDRVRLERYAAASGRSLSSAARYLIRRSLSEFEAESPDAV